MYLSCSETPRRAASGLNCRRILFVSFIAIALGGGFTNRAAAGCPTCRDSVRTQDQIWYISCRCAGCPDNSTGENSLTTGQYEPAKQQWQKSDLARFYAADDGRARYDDTVNASHDRTASICEDVTPA